MGVALRSAASRRAMGLRSSTNFESGGEAEMILNFSFADFYLSKVNSATSSLPAQPHIVTFEFEVIQI